MSWPAFYALALVKTLKTRQRTNAKVFGVSFKEGVLCDLCLLRSSERGGSRLLAGFGLGLVIEATRSSEHGNKHKETQISKSMHLVTRFCSGSTIRLGALLPATPQFREGCRPSGLRFIASVGSAQRTRHTMSLHEPRYDIRER